MNRIRRYELTIVPAPQGGVYLCDDEGNRDWYPSYAAAKARAGRYLIET